MKEILVSLTKQELKLIKDAISYYLPTTRQTDVARRDYPKYVLREQLRELYDALPS